MSHGICARISHNVVFCHLISYSDVRVEMYGPGNKLKVCARADPFPRV